MGDHIIQNTAEKVVFAEDPADPTARKVAIMATPRSIDEPVLSTIAPICATTLTLGEEDFVNDDDKHVSAEDGDTSSDEEGDAFMDEVLESLRLINGRLDKLEAHLDTLGTSVTDLQRAHVAGSSFEAQTGPLGDRLVCTVVPNGVNVRIRPADAPQVPPIAGLGNGPVASTARMGGGFGPSGPYRATPPSVGVGVGPGPRLGMGVGHPQPARGDPRGGVPSLAGVRTSWDLNVPNATMAYGAGASYPQPSYMQSNSAFPSSSSSGRLRPQGLRVTNERPRDHGMYDNDTDL